MKISFIDDEPQIFPQQYGGKARTIINLAEYFSHHPEVEKVSVISSSIEHTKDEFQWHNIHFKRLEGYEILPAFQKEAQEADILSIHNCSIAFPWLVRPKAALIYHLHDVLVSDADRGSHLDKALAGKWDAIVAPSRFAADVYSAFSQNIGNTLKPTIIARGLNPEMFQPIKKAKALSKIEELYPQNPIKAERYPLVFLPWRGNAGKGEEFLRYLRSALSKKYKDYLILTTFDDKTISQDEHVLNLGWVDSVNMKYIYSAADVVVSFSTLPESFSQVCIEAVACGTPFLCFGFGNLAELANTLPSVIQCQPSAQAVAAGLSKALSLEEKVITESRAIVSKTYDADKIGQAYLKLFRRLTKTKTSTNSTPKFFVSPFCHIARGTAYITTKTGLKEYKLNASELKLLAQCRQPSSHEDLVLTTHLDDVTIDNIINSLGGSGLLVRM